MKLYTFSLLFMMLILGCSSDAPIEPSNKYGSLNFKIDRTSLPANVTTVSCTLSRSGFNNVTSSVSTTSNNAELNIQNIAAGEWNLRVNASDAANIILYTGETSVNVVSGTTTSINLSLTSTGNGFGNVIISVSWGNNPPWMDYYNNPILTYEGNSFDYAGIFQPIVVKDSNNFKMWYGGLVTGSVTYGFYAVSSEGLNWTKYSTTPIFSPGPPASWDAQSVHPGAVIKEDGLYKMYYTGWADYTGRWSIGLATSSDGISWTKHPVPVFNGTSGWEYSVAVSSVLKHNGVYYMYYAGKSSSSYTYKIGLATSVDGINWSRYSGNPILIPTFSWEGSTISYPSVIYENNQFKMVYMANGTSISAFGYAVSSDGKVWNKNAQPFFTEQNTSNNWGVSDIAYPNFITIGNEHRVYYSAFNQTHNNKYKIGLIRKNN